ncbi:hypothetical protein AB0H37_36650 [Actinomadura sp. NPDC023710]|uniref:hypothetical protein n=1 Tax=Actinomadura sp. NPDC023710 TaxID=3158219 RepID=UPI0033F619E7
MARRVVCGRLLVIATFVPTSAFINVDLPTLGRPMKQAKPEFIAFLSSLGPDGPPSSRNAGDRRHRSGSPCGSLRDQVLASSNLPSDAIATIEVVA